MAQSDSLKPGQPVLNQLETITTAFLEMAPMVSLAFDTQGHCVLANQRALELLHRSREDVIGKPLEQIMPEQLRQHVMDGHRRVLEGHAPTSTEVELVNSEGGTRRCLFASMPFYDESGKIVATGLTGQDVTVLRQSESDREMVQAELHESRQALQGLLDNIPAAVFVKDREGRMILVNQALADQLQASQEELLGKTVHEFMRHDAADRFWADEFKVIETGQPSQSEDMIPLPDGDHYRVMFRFPLRDARGEPYAVGCIVSDITEQRRALQERDKAQRDLIESQRAALAELSSPIIPVLNGIIILPLVGAVDSQRAREITRSLLAGITEFRAKVVIIDITGVGVVDSVVADHLNRTIQAARLKGAETILTGITDAVAEAIVDLGIDWSDLQTLTDLQQGLVVALRATGKRLLAE